MRKVMVLATAMTFVSVSPSLALKDVSVHYSELSDWEARAVLDQGRSVAPGDTVCFGGDGSGDGVIVTGGVWDWEGTNNEAPEFFEDGDPVGNQFRDGWTFRRSDGEDGSVAERRPALERRRRLQLRLRRDGGARRARRGSAGRMGASGHDPC